MSSSLHPSGEEKKGQINGTISGSPLSNGNHPVASSSSSHFGTSVSKVGLDGGLMGKMKTGEKGGKDLVKREVVEREEVDLRLQERLGELQRKRRKIEQRGFTGDEVDQVLQTANGYVHFLFPNSPNICSNKM